MTKDGPFCGCFGSPRGRQSLPPRPKSAPEKGIKFQAASIEQDEAWKIGSQVTQTLQPQTSTPPVSPGRPVDSVHGVAAIRLPLGPSVPSGGHNGSAPASSPLKPASVADMDLNHTMMQSQSPAAAAVIDTSAINQQQQQVSEQQHKSSYTAKEEAAQPSGSIAAAASSQASDRSQHMQHGIPGFGAMSPEQQSASILTKWGVTPSPELQMQLQTQQAPEQQQQQQQVQTNHTQLEATPSHNHVAQQGGLTTLASPANAPDGLTIDSDQALPAALGGASAPEASLHAALADVGQRDRTNSMQVQQASQLSASTTSMNAAVQHHQTAHVAATHSGQQPQGNAQGSSLVSEHMVGKEEGLALEQPDNEGSSGNLLQRGAKGGSVLVSERTDVVEGGLGLEQPDGEGSNPLWTPEVVRGRVVRATEMWHRQRIQQEASQQAQQTSDDLAHLRGHNQNEQLAVPLLRLAGAVQAALAWQQKVGEYSVQSLALSQQAASVHTQPSGPARQLSGLSKKSTTVGIPRAVQQMEAQMRATRQDALQLATAVVRLEKEKAVLQKQVSGQYSRASHEGAMASTPTGPQATPTGAPASPVEGQATPPAAQGTPACAQATPSRHQENGCMEGSATDTEHFVVEGDEDRKSTAAHVSQETADRDAVDQLQQHSIQSTADWIHGRQHDAGVDVDVDADINAQASSQPEAATALAAATDCAEAMQASPRAARSSSGSPMSRADMSHRRKPWGSSMHIRLGSRGSNQSPEASGSRDRLVGNLPLQRGLSQSSLRLRSGLSAVSSFFTSFNGGKNDSSRSEGYSPRHHAKRLPSFMDSTRSSQAHVHKQSSPGVAEFGEQGVQKQPFRPSGVHIVSSSDSDGEHAAEGKAQQAQHGHAELSTCSIASVVSSSFLNSSQSSRAHHHAEKLERQHAQHGLRKDEELVGELDAFRMHHSHDDMSDSSTAGRRDETIPDTDQGSIHYDVAPSQPGRESQTSVVSVLGTRQGLGEAKHFMQPTASSLAHTNGSSPTSMASQSQ